MENGKLSTFLKKFFFKDELNELEKLKEENRKLKKESKKLQILNSSKDELISAISHEFKNPIAVINGYCQTLLDDENLSVDMRKKFLAKIYKNGEKLNGLIDTLRLSVKLDNKKQPMNFSNINLYEVIVESIENIKLNYPNRKTTIKGNKDIWIKADTSLFGILVINLVENAFKYSDGEVIINFSEKSLDIIDSGIGISPKNLQNITDKFYRVSNNSWNNSLGLGLFIVNNIVNLHKFSLHIKSKENEGSTFSIKF
jgi:signal transduction histidine kinase